MNEVFQTAQRIIEETGGPAFVQVPDAIVLAAAYDTGKLTWVTACGDFLWTHASVKATGAFHFNIYSEEDSEYLANDKVRSEHFWASGGNWTPIPPKLLRSGRAIRFEVEDRSNTANTIRFALGGYQILTADKVDRAAQFYGRQRGLRFLVTPAASANGTTVRGGTTITANQPASKTIVSDPSYHLRVSQIAADATSDSWRGRFKYVDPRLPSTIPFANARLDSTCWTGRAQTGSAHRGLYRVERCPIFKASTNVDLDLEDYSGSTNYAHHTFIGERISDAEAHA